jgi:hypothetical protein
LYEKEARAMVKTWRSNWFGEEGTRLLYLLPQKQTDDILPLRVTPKPDAVVRTMVGRLELLTPAQEARIEKLIGQLGAPGPAEREDATRQLAGLGRFAEPSLQRVLKTSQDPETRARAKELVGKMKQQ